MKEGAGNSKDILEPFLLNAGESGDAKKGSYKRPPKPVKIASCTVRGQPCVNTVQDDDSSAEVVDGNKCCGKDRQEKKKVYVSFDLYSLNKIDESNGIFEASFILYCQWID